MHVTEIVKQVQVSDEAVAVTIRCCSDPKTDSTLTVYGVAKLSPEAVLDWLDKHHDRVAAKCAGMAAGKALLGVKLAQSKVHE